MPDPTLSRRRLLCGAPAALAALAMPAAVAADPIPAGHREAVRQAAQLVGPFVAAEWAASRPHPTAERFANDRAAIALLQPVTDHLRELARAYVAEFGVLSDPNEYEAVRYRVGEYLAEVFLLPFAEGMPDFLECSSVLGDLAEMDGALVTTN